MPTIRLRAARLAAPLLVLALLTVGAAPAAADAWPTRPVKLVTAFTPGGLTDVVARLLVPHYEAAFGRNVVVENRPGGGGLVGTDHVAKAPPDGYTLLFTTSAVHGAGPNLHPSLPFHPVDDFTHISRVGLTPLFLFVNAEAPYRTLAEFAAASRAKPGGFNYGSPGPGSLGHLTGELIRLTVGAAMTHVPYKGTLPAQNDLLSRQIEAMVDNLPPARGMVDAGRLRALAISTEQRLPLLPDVPSFVEAGFPAVVSSAWVSLCGPARLPAELVERLNLTTRRILEDPALRARLTDLGLTPDGQLSAAEQTAFVRSEIARWGKVVREAGVKLEP